MIEITANTRRAIVTNKELLTTSSAGIQVQFTFSEDWDSLSRFAIFRNGEEGQEVAVALPNSNLVVIPAQSCSEDYVDEPVFVGMYGTDGLGAVIIPTIWTSLGVLRPGAVTTEIITPAEPTPDMWAQILAIANEAMAIADECEENEELRIAAEQLRANAETARANAETLRAQAETEWSWNETQRQTAEYARAQAEILRIQAEELRQANETSRVSAENDRASAEQTRQSQETTRASNETARVTAEQGRASAESGRVTAETNRVSAETVRTSAESARATAEQNRASAETARASAESARATAESTRASNEQSRVSAETARAQAEAGRATEFATWESTIASKVPNTRTVNGKALSADITLDSGDIGYDASETYQSGTVGYEVAELTRQLNDETTGLDSKAPVILETASGAIASFDDGADSMPIRKIVATIEPVQEGTGDPSPDNVRPISGWTGCDVIQRGQNLIDGTIVRDIILNSISTASRGESPSGWVWFQPTGVDGYPTIFGVSANNKKNRFKFKENTAYTIVFTSTCQYTGNLNIGYTYTDGTRILVTQDTTAQVSHRIVTNAAKTLKNIWVGRNITGWTSIYYPTFCVCEGDVALEDIPTQQSATLPINWETEAGTVYGGTVTLNEDGSADVVSNRVITVLDGSADEDWSNGGYGASVKWYLPTELYNNIVLPDSSVPYDAIANYLRPIANSADWNTNDNYFSRAGRYCYMKCSTIGAYENWRGYLAENPLTILFRLNNPTTYHFSDIGQLTTFLGTNNVWCDTGDITELVYPVDTTAAIDAGDAENASAISTLSGSLATVETTSTASKAYAVGELLVYNNQLYKVASAIAAGGTLTPGTNIVATMVEAELNGKLDVPATAGTAGQVLSLSSDLVPTWVDKQDLWGLREEILTTLFPSTYRNSVINGSEITQRSNRILARYGSESTGTYQAFTISADAWRRIAGTAGVSSFNTNDLQMIPEAWKNPNINIYLVMSTVLSAGSHGFRLITVYEDSEGTISLNNSANYTGAAQYATINLSELFRANNKIGFAYQMLSRNSTGVRNTYFDVIIERATT